MSSSQLGTILIVILIIIQIIMTICLSLICMVSIVKDKGHTSKLPNGHPPGYSNFNKRIGLDTNTLGGKPRSLEFSEGEEVVNKEEVRA